MTSISWDWIGNHLRVKVLCSYAGLATQILVNEIESDNNLLIDVGDGILRDFLNLPRKYFENIQAVLITHGHFDHVGGLFSLLSFFRMINRTEKLTLVCPKNVVELQGIIKTFRDSYKDSIPFPLDIVEIDSEIKLDSVKITPFAVQHRGSIIGGGELPDIPTLGFVLTKEGEKVLYTSDTGFFKNLKIYINDVDFALIEGTNKDKGSTYHMSIPEAEELGKLAKNYLIIHKLPPIKG
ncbi:MAG: MBL fold metallo-hydrolase [Candidatus Heimdallarchaeota archaeon]|nr:MBL fold metallo-hydrolase [Candidatus Heimdallarchaeota archaeon]MCK4769311.1 MBL fold metallo-hydrolase [Candidatus Heimdallarchaeota archaeon]